MTEYEDLHFFGVDPSTGGPSRPPKTWTEIRDCVVATFRLHEHQRGVAKQTKEEKSKAQADHRGRPPQGIDAKDLAQTGWGVVYAGGVGEDVKAALKPLLDHRCKKAGPLFKVFDDAKKLSAGVRASQWLRHLGVGVGVGDVTKVPYYLMLVGNPKNLPFGVEFDLAGSSYAVGRLSFATVDEYARYAENVVAAETKPPRCPLRLTIVGTEHPDDVTRASMHHLVRPIVEKFEDTAGWDVEAVLGDDATKAKIAGHLGGRQTPSIFFFAGHALDPGPQGDLERLGALLCAPYPGPVQWKRRGPLTEDLIFGAADVGKDADLRGLVAVLFGCYTAGIPSHDSFCYDTPRPLGDGTARMATLASRLLAHERGALAVLGHVDRAWSYSYHWRGVPQPHAFESVLGALLDGEPLGAAAAFLNDRYQALVLELLHRKMQVLQRKAVDVDGFVLDWMAERDARAFLVYGDPAVRVGRSRVSRRLWAWPFRCRADSLDR